MLVKRIWIRQGRCRPVRWEGWYLLGFIPLFLRQLTLDEP